MAKSKQRESPRASYLFNKKKGKEDDKPPVIYRDGEPIKDKSPEELARILGNHVDPNHPDYNPDGDTHFASAIEGVPYIKEAMDDHSAMQAARKAGGKKTGDESRPQGESTREAALNLRDELTKSGKSRPEIVQIIRERLKISPSQVRRILAADEKRA